MFDQSEIWYAVLICPLQICIKKIHKNQMGDDVMVTSFKFLHTIVHISKSTEPTNFIFGTNIHSTTLNTFNDKSANDLGKS